MLTVSADGTEHQPPRSLRSGTRAGGQVASLQLNHAAMAASSAFPSPTNPRGGAAPPRRLQEASLGISPPLTDAQVHSMLRHKALELDHEFREVNKRSMLNAVSGGWGAHGSAGRAVRGHGRGRSSRDA
jgi:hypothetical protein